MSFDPNRLTGLREKTRDERGLGFAQCRLQFQPPTAILLSQSSICLAELDSLWLVKETSVCDADDSTTHSFSLSFRGPKGQILEICDEDRYASWDRDLDALSGDLLDTARHLAKSLGVPLWTRSPGQKEAQLWQPPQPDAEQTHRASGNFELALQACEQLLLAQPGQRSALRRKGDYLQRLGRYSEAATTFRQLLASQPEDSTARLGLAQALIEHEHLPEAIELLKDGIRIEPKLALRARLADLLGLDCYDPEFERLIASLAGH